jgi:hypothetical protein
MVIIEEIRCIVFIDSERFLQKIEHPSSKVVTKIAVGNEFDLDSLSLTKYQEFVIVYDLKRLKIFDLSLDRFSCTKLFLQLPLEQEPSQILLQPELLMNSSSLFFITDQIDCFIFDLKTGDFEVIHTK